MYQLGKATGICPNMLSAWCRDDGIDVKSTIETLDAICQELSCDVADLFEIFENKIRLVSFLCNKLFSHVQTLKFN